MASRPRGAQAEQAAATGRRMPVKTIDIRPGHGYEAYTVTMRTNPHYGTKIAFTSGDTPRVIQAWAELIMDWDLTDEAGQPHPLPSADLTVFDRIPDELLDDVFNQYIERTTKAAELPKG